jgi:anti-sigma factor RsiW
MNDRKRIEDGELHAYVDGHLSAGRHREVHAHLLDHPGEAARVLDYQTINQALHAFYDNTLDEAVPERLQHWRRRRYLQPLARVAGVAGLLLFGGLLGWLAHDQWHSRLSNNPARFVTTAVDQAMLAHAMYTREVRHAVEVPAEQEKHLVAWLSKRLETELRAPRLAQYGFHLLGGRLLPVGSGQPAAQFMYEDTSGRRLTLYFWKEAGAAGMDSSFRFIRQQQTHVFYWFDRHLGYALIGDFERTELSAIADTVYEQLAYRYD